MNGKLNVKGKITGRDMVLSSKKAMTRTELINYIIKKQGYSTYLEIGIGTGKNFEAIKCRLKVGVDPAIEYKKGKLYNETSDSFFAKNNGGYDIIFIDGLHHADQVRKDIINAWAC